MPTRFLRRSSPMCWSFFLLQRQPAPQFSWKEPRKGLMSFQSKHLLTSNIIQVFYKQIHLFAFLDHAWTMYGASSNCNFHRRLINTNVGYLGPFIVSYRRDRKSISFLPRSVSTVHSSAFIKPTIPRHLLINIYI